LLASWRVRQVFEHYLIGRLAVVFVKLSESGAAGRGVFFEPKPGERKPIQLDEVVDRSLVLVGSRQDTTPSWQSLNDIVTGEVKPSGNKFLLNPTG
jgi:hypothetical protein